MIKTILILISFISVSSVAQNDFDQLKKLVAADRKAATLFGFNVAICRNYAIAGAQYESTNEEGNNYKGGAGAAYIFKKIGKSWAQVKKIVHYDRSEEDEFGSSVAISDEYAMVGVPEKKKTDDGDTIFNTGAVYVFKNDNGGDDNWGFVQKLVSSHENSSDRFGSSLAISDNYAIIGADGEGAAYVYERAENSWEMKKKLVSLEINDYFGVSVAISGDNAIVGARLGCTNENHSDTINSAGAAYIYSKDQGGQGTWGLVKKIVSSDRIQDAEFGNSVALSGEYAIVGAQQAYFYDGDYIKVLNTAAAYIFSKNYGGNENWGQVEKIVPSGMLEYESSCNVAMTGNYAVISAVDYSDLDMNGYPKNSFVYIFEKDRDASNNWTQIKKVVPEKEYEAFNSVAIFEDNLMIGATGDNYDENGLDSLTAAGAAYILGPVTPDTQASNLTMSNVDTFSMRIEWNRGNGQKCAVFVKQGNSGDALPVDSAVYNPSTTFKNGTQIGADGWYCVYNDTGSSVEVTGLESGNDYIVQVFEYSVSKEGIERYLTTVAENNPKIRKTLIIPSITAWPVASEISYGQKFSSSVLSGHAAATPGSFSFENPESTSTAGVVNQYVLFTPEDTSTYSSIRKELSITVNKIELNITGISVSGKFFDGNNNAAIEGTAILNGVLPGDEETVTLTGTPSAKFADASVGTDKPVTVTGYIISGPAAENYSIKQPVGLTADIKVAPPMKTPVITSIYPDSIRIGINVKLSCSTVVAATGYRFQVSRTPGFDSLIIDTVINTNEYTAYGMGNDNTCYFRIAGVNAGGNGPWSSSSHFTTLISNQEIQESFSAVLTDTLNRISSEVYVNTGTETEGCIVTVAMSNKKLQDTSIIQSSSFYDFTKSPKSNNCKFMTLKFAIPDTFPDGTPVTPQMFEKIHLNEVDSTGSLKAVYGAVIDTNNRTISYHTDNLGVYVLSIDLKAPAIIDRTEIASMEKGSIPVITGLVIDNISNNQVNVYFRKGGEKEFDSLPVMVKSDSSFGLQISQIKMDQNGFEYFITAFDGTYSVTIERKDIPVKIKEKSQEKMLPQKQWHLFSTPLNLSDGKISSVLKEMGEYRKDWRLFQKSLTSINDSFIEYGPDLENIGTGYSYWLKTVRDNMQMKIDSGTTTPISHPYEIEIPSKRWASIGNPYLFAVSWQSIIDSTGSSASALIGPYTYENNNWIPPVSINSLVPWQGYYVFNNGDSTITLKIPSICDNGALAKRFNSCIAFDWSISSSEGYDYRNYFGFAVNATDDYDAEYDYPKPGSPENSGPVSWFERPGFKKVASRFQTDFTNMEDGGATWSVVASALKKDIAYKCEIGNMENIPDSISIIIVDKHSGKTHDVRTHGIYAFTPFENEYERNFVIIAGNNSYMKNCLKGVSLPPQSLHLTARSLRNHVNVSYTLPWSQSAIQVKIDILDINGRLVANLCNAKQTAGYYSVPWQMRNSNGSRTAAGVYMICLQAGKNHKIDRVNIVK